MINDLKELIDKVNNENDVISVSLKDRNIAMHNIINPNELIINDDEISIESGNFIANITLDSNVRIYKNENEIEEGYILKNENFELYISLL